jgi:hypothetical protein
MCMLDLDTARVCAVVYLLMCVCRSRLPPSSVRLSSATDYVLLLVLGTTMSAHRSRVLTGLLCIGIPSG